MDDHLLQPAFGRSPLYNLLVDGVGRDKTIDDDWFSLANTVAPILRL